MPALLGLPSDPSKAPQLMRPPMACRGRAQGPIRPAAPKIPEVFRENDPHRDSWVTDPALLGTLKEGLAAASSPKVRLQVVVQALTRRLDPACVLSCLQETGVHPATLALATTNVRIQEGLARFLVREGETWSVKGDSMRFTGAAVPKGLMVPGTLVLEDGPGDIDLPADLDVSRLEYQNCRGLQRLGSLPASLKDLRIENAPALIALPDSVEVMSGFQVSACPRLEHLPGYIHAAKVKISHCPGIRSIWARIRCTDLALETLINLVDLDLDLSTGRELELRLPSLRSLRGTIRSTGTLRIACPGLRSMEVNLKAADLIVENCSQLERIVGTVQANNLYIRRNASLVSIDGGFVVGASEFQDLPALRSVDPTLVTSSRTVRFERCASLAELPYGISYRGSLELLDLPALNCWPENMNVGLLTALGCPQLPDPPPGVVIRSAFRRARPEDRESLAREVAEGTSEARAAIAGLRLLVRALKASNVPLQKAMSLLREDGEDPAAILVAAAAEGLGLQDFLDNCAQLANGPGGLAEAATVCARASIHPASLAFVVRDRTKARWVAELLSESQDLATGLVGDGTLRIRPEAAWDLPEDLVVPGSVKVEGGKGPVHWPRGLRALGGISLPVERFLGEQEASAS